MVGSMNKFSETSHRVPRHNGGGRNTAETWKARIAWSTTYGGQDPGRGPQIVGTSRARVLRTLAQSRGRRTVQIPRDLRLSHCVELESQARAQIRVSQGDSVPHPNFKERVYREFNPQ